MWKKPLGHLTLVLLLQALIENSCVSASQTPEITEPASVASAAAVLDLSRYKVPKDAEAVSPPRVAAVHFRQQGMGSEIYKAMKEQLKSLGCTELPGTVETDQYCTSSFEKQGFRISTMMLPGGQAGEWMVTIDNHSNIQLDQLPRSGNAKLQFASAAMAMFKAAAPQKQVSDEVAKLMVKAGWEPYGSAGDQLFFRRNAVIVSINCAADPSANNTTFLQYSSQLVSAEIPLPPDAVMAQYADVTQELSFSTTSSIDAIGKFYETSLSKSGWKPTSEKPTAVDFDFVQIFRTERGQLMRLLIKDNQAESRRDVRMKLWSEQPASKNKPE